MTLIALTSAGDAPGVTTTAFAMTLASPDPALLAECSPAGGKVLRGYFRGATPPSGGLWELALAAVRGSVATAEEALWEHVVPLDPERRHLLLPGLDDPFLSAELSATAWETLAATLARLPFTVLADAGPIGPDQPFAVLRAADRVVLVMRPTLAQVLAARPRLARLRQALRSPAPLGLCLIGEHPYTASDVRTELGDFDPTIVFPADDGAAAVLSEGSGSDRTRRKAEASALMRAARTAIARLAADHTSTVHETDPPLAREGTV